MSKFLYYLTRFIRRLMFWIPLSESEILIHRCERIITMNEKLTNKLFDQKITLDEYNTQSKVIIDYCNDALEWANHSDFICENETERNVKHSCLVILEETKKMIEMNSR